MNIKITKINFKEKKKESIEDFYKTFYESAKYAYQIPGEKTLAEEMMEKYDIVVEDSTTDDYYLEDEIEFKVKKKKKKYPKKINFLLNTEKMNIIWFNLYNNLIIFYKNIKKIGFFENNIIKDKLNNIKVYILVMQVIYLGIYAPGTKHTVISGFNELQTKSFFFLKEKKIISKLYQKIKKKMDFIEKMKYLIKDIFLIICIFLKFKKKLKKRKIKKKILENFERKKKFAYNRSITIIFNNINLNIEIIFLNIINNIKDNFLNLNININSNNKLISLKKMFNLSLLFNNFFYLSEIWIKTLNLKKKINKYLYFLKKNIKKNLNQFFFFKLKKKKIKKHIKRYFLKSIGQQIEKNVNEKMKSFYFFYKYWKLSWDYINKFILLFKKINNIILLRGFFLHENIINILFLNIYDIKKKIIENWKKIKEKKIKLFYISQNIYISLKKLKNKHIKKMKQQLYNYINEIQKKFIIKYFNIKYNNFQKQIKLFFFKNYKKNILLL